MNDEGAPGHRPASFWIQTGIDLANALQSIREAGTSEFEELRRDAKKSGATDDEADRAVHLAMLCVLYDSCPDIVARIDEARVHDNNMGSNSHLVGYI